MIRILAIFRSETIYFVGRLAENARRVIYSDMVHSFTSPLTDIFISAFIWRNAGSLVAVVVYKIGEWIFLPITFYINGQLLKRFAVQKTFSVGAMLAGFTPLILIFFNSSGNDLIFLCGCLYGIGNGFYWANRNYLEFKETVTDARRYFFSVSSAVSNFSKIVVPVVAGWIIVSGTKFNLYTSNQAYQGIFVIAFFLLVVCAIIIRHGKFESLYPESLGVKSPSFLTKRRMLNIAHGLIDGVGFISGIILFYFLGNEGALGIALSLTAVCGIIVIYIYGRLSGERHERPTILISALLFIICALSLAILPSAIGIFIYVIVIGVAFNFFMIPATAMTLALSEQEANMFFSSSYAFIIDNELFLNIGRMIGAIMVIGLVVFVSQRAGLFYGPLLIALLHGIFTIFFLKKR